MRLLANRYILVLLATLLLSAPSVVAQTNSNTPAPPRFGVIKGKVVNEAGQPLANASVTVSRFDSVRSDQSILSDSEGKFELTGLEQSAYRLSARLAAYTPLLQASDAEDTKYRAGDTVTLVLVKGGVITGTVTNPAGEPVVGIRVRARMKSGAERLPWPYRFQPNERFTDDRGVYRIYGLPTGTYIVSAGGTGEQSWRADPFEAHAPTYAPASTRDTADEISVRAGEETRDVDIRFRNEPGRSISGRAIAPGGSESGGFGIRLSSVKDNGGPALMTGQQPGHKGFMFQGLADGEYEIIAFSANASEEFMWSEPKRIKVNGADVTGVELTTLPLSAVSGKVVLKELKDVECADKQRPILSETIVSARRKTAAQKFEVPFFVSGSPINADAEGNVLFKNLLPDQYYFGAQFSGKSWYLDSITLPPQANTESRVPLQAKPVEAAKTWTTLKSGQRLSGLTITIAQGAASIEGQTKEPEKLWVYLVPAEREHADDVLRFFATVTNEGKVKLENVAPGRYFVLVTDEELALSKLRSPDGVELRARLRREAEAGKSELELKPCENVTNFEPQMTRKERI